MGRISPNYIVQDGVIPRTALPRVLRDIAALAAAAGLRVANVFHAGDGNLHPLVLYDRRVPGQEHVAETLAFAILQLCVGAGGSITGEHGVGMEKKAFMPVMFAEPDLDTMQRVRCAFDPQRIANPDKIFPRPRLCGESPGPYQPHPLENRRRGGTLLTGGPMTAATASPADFAAIVGEDYVKPTDSAAAILGCSPAWMLAPGSPEEVAAVLRAASSAGWRIAPRGGGSKLGWGNPPPALDAILSLHRLNRVLEHAWGDMTATVEAGCTVAHLQQTLEAHGQRLALDPLWPQQATVGGILSTNDMARSASASAHCAIK